MKIETGPGKEEGSIAAKISVDRHAFVAAICEGVLKEIIETLGDDKTQWADRTGKCMEMLGDVFISGTQFGRSETFSKELVDKYLGRALAIEELHKQYTKELEVMKLQEGQA